MDQVNLASALWKRSKQDLKEEDYKEFYKINYEAMRLSDDLIDLEIEHINRILDKIHNDPEDWDIKLPEFDLWTKVKETAQASRRTGLGFTALGDTLAALGVSYDSKEGLEIIEHIMHYKLMSELDCTTDLAILRGTFKGWDSDLEFDLIESNFLTFFNTSCDHLLLHLFLLRHPIQYSLVFQLRRIRPQGLLQPLQHH